jgi:hypothetical protein
MVKEQRRNSSVFKHLLGAVAVGAAVLVGFVLGLWVGDRNRRPEEPVTVVDTLSLGIVSLPDTAAVVEPVRDTVPEVSESTRKERREGIDYLTKHNRWNRDEMEKLPALKGLWDAVNHYDVETIRKYAEVLECQPLTTIIEGLDTSQKTGYYAAKNDRNITLSTYIRRLQQ